jgi:uncharacterized membrane protein YdbT with pleckstrin-like domain
MLDPTTIYILASLAIFVFGVGGGYLLTRGDNTFSRSKLQTAIALAVTLVWIISIVAEIIIPAYTVSVLVHGIMGAVVGYLFSEDGLNINIGGE